MLSMVGTQNIVGKNIDSISRQRNQSQVPVLPEIDGRNRAQKKTRQNKGNSVRRKTRYEEKLGKTWRLVDAGRVVDGDGEARQRLELAVQPSAALQLRRRLENEEKLGKKKNPVRVKKNKQTNRC